MNRQAFKQRMQKYKAYKEQNPDARYLQWKEALPKIYRMTPAIIFVELMNQIMNL